MSENYVVNYDIQVQANSAVAAITSFQRAVNNLVQTDSALHRYVKEIERTTAQFHQLAKAVPTFKINTDVANKRLDTLINKLQKIQSLAQSSPLVTPAAFLEPSITHKAGKVQRTTKAPKQPQVPTVPKPDPAYFPPVTVPKTPQTPKIPKAPKIPKPPKVIDNRILKTPSNLSYKILGPSMVDSGGIGALDLFKGMGIAYGMSGIGSMVGNTISAATEFNNIMETTKNILRTNDQDPFTFEQRFKEMSSIARAVGVRTKYTAPEVADASKFLAMAGLDIQAINDAINPITDLALIGDTDLGTTADVTTNIMTGYGLNPKQMRKAADVMVSTFTSSNTTLMEMAEAYKYSASLLSAGQVQFEESAAAIGILGDAGIKGSQAGTTMRTIMNNLVNPTKKQLKKWEQIGVQRYDDFGNLRSLHAIFADLNKAHLGLPDFFGLFHKTAAQGAVSLASNVEKWNEIIEKNFLSDGLSKALAEKKMDTIQGLWAQLTSTFTDLGISQFEDKENPIKAFIKETTEWLKGSDAKTFFKTLSDNLMDLIGTMKMFGGIFVKLYNQFGGIITQFLKLQMVMSAFKGIGSIVKGVYTFSAGAFKTISSTPQFFNELTGVGKKMLGTGASLGTGMKIKAQWLGQKPQVNGHLIPLELYSRRFTNGPEHLRVLKQQKMVWGNLANGIGNMLGGAGGAWIGSQIGEPGSNLNIASTIAGSVGGGYAIPWAVGKIGGLLGKAGLSSIGSISSAAAASPALAALGPLALLLLTVGGGTYLAYDAWEKYQQKIREATEATQQFAKQTKELYQLDYSDITSVHDKMLKLHTDDTLSANEALEKWIQLKKEQLGLIKSSGNEDTYQSSKTLQEQFGGLRENAEKLIFQNGWFSFLASTGTDVTGVQTLLDQYGVNAQKKVRKQGFVGADGTIYAEEANYSINGINFSDKQLQKAAVPILFMQHLASGKMSGTPSEAFTNDWLEKFKSASNLEEYESIRKQVRDVIDSMKWNPNKEMPSIDRITETTKQSDLYDEKFYVKALQATQRNNFLGEDPLNPIFQLLDAYENALKYKDKHGSFGLDVLSNVLAASGVQYFDTSKYGTPFTPEWYKQMGYDISTNTWESVHGQTIEHLKKIFMSIPEDIKVATEGFPAEFRKAIHSMFIDLPVWQLGSDVLSNTQDGETMQYQNDTWVYNKGFWRQQGGPGFMSSQDMMKNLANPLGSNGTGTNLHRLNVNPGDYRSQYQSNTAAPKQVIVKIENLMNVKSIDLTNPDNTAVIENIKGQLTQVLVDVVHDFDATFHG